MNLDHTIPSNLELEQTPVDSTRHKHKKKIRHQHSQRCFDFNISALWCPDQLTNSPPVETKMQ
jgi:hypothetical protein